MGVGGGEGGGCTCSCRSEAAALLVDHAMMKHLLWFGYWCLVFGVWGLGFRVWDLVAGAGPHLALLRVEALDEWFELSSVMNWGLGFGV